MSSTFLPSHTTVCSVVPTCPHLPSLRTSIPASAAVFKDECTQCFDTDLSPAGINLCLTCYNGGCPTHSARHVAVAGKDHSLVLNIYKRELEIDVPADPKDRLLAPTFEALTRVLCLTCQVEIEKNAALEKMTETILSTDSALKPVSIGALEVADEAKECIHVKELQQVAHPLPIPDQAATHCSKCEIKDGLWLCLTCGMLGCPRKQHGGGPGSGNAHAMAHHKETGHPCVLKLGTISPDGKADMYCYACDNPLLDSQLAAHLRPFGMNVADAKKTVLTTEELANELLRLHDWNAAYDPDGTEATLLFGSGYTGFKNCGNTCYIASTLQMLFSLPFFQKRYFADGQQHLLTCRNNRPGECYQCQMAKIGMGLLSGKYDPQPSKEQLAEYEEERHRRNEEKKKLMAQQATGAAAPAGAAGKNEMDVEKKGGESEMVKNAPPASALPAAAAAVAAEKKRKKPDTDKALHTHSATATATAHADGKNEMDVKEEQLKDGSAGEKKMKSDHETHDESAAMTVESTAPQRKIKPLQEGVPPRMFKKLIAKDHHEFSTGQQQDARDFFQYYIEEAKKREHVNSVDPTQPFRFELEDRIQCQSCGGVRYRTSTQTELALPVPVDALALKNLEVFRNEQQKKKDEEEKAKKEGKVIVIDKADIKEPELPALTFDECVKEWSADATVEDFACSQCGRKTKVSKRQRFVSYPDVLFVQMRRFVAFNWTPVKLVVDVHTPDQIELDALRAKGLQAGEKELPSEAKAAKPQAKPEIVSALESMGFGNNAAQRAALAVNNSSAESASEWLMAHLEDANLNDPLPADEPAKPKSAADDVPADMVNDLHQMGFPKDRCAYALKQTQLDMERAVEWLFSHADEPLPTASSSSSASASASSSSSSSSASRDSRPAKYRLIGFINHLGTSATTGHYVAHLMKEGRWVQYNDEKVFIAKDPPKSAAYIYVFRRT